MSLQYTVRIVESRKIQFGRKTVRDPRDTCQLVPTCYFYSAKTIEPSIGLFFVPSTFHERHIHSMTKRVLDDLVDYAHFASAAPPQSTDNIVLPTIKRYLLIVASQHSSVINNSLIHSKPRHHRRIVSIVLSAYAYRCFAQVRLVICISSSTLHAFPSHGLVASSVMFW